MTSRVALKTGFEGWDFTLKAIGDDVSREGRLRAKMWTEVCPRSESNCLCISTHSSWNVRWTGGVSLDFSSASYPFRSAGSQVLWVFSLKSPTVPCLLFLSSLFVLQPTPTWSPSFPPGRPPICSPHFHQSQLGEGESTSSACLPNAFHSGLWPAGESPNSPP